ncbi:MAG: hypothetical protein V7603_6295 [Micromonosporaceae bacterium]
MSEPVGTNGLLDTQTALDREVDVLAQRFPQVDQAELGRCVRDTYAELERDAEIRSHLVALTRAQVSEKLRQRGLKVHVRGEDAG